RPAASARSEEPPRGDERARTRRPRRRLGRPLGQPGWARAQAHPARVRPARGALAGRGSGAQHGRPPPSPLGRAVRAVREHRSRHPGAAPPQARRSAADRDRHRLGIPDSVMRPTVRLRLTAWYASIFLLAGAILLTISYVIVSRNTTSFTTRVGAQLTAKG